MFSLTQTHYYEINIVRNLGSYFYLLVSVVLLMILLKIINCFLAKTK